MSIRNVPCGTCGAETLEVVTPKLAVTLEGPADPAGTWRLTSNGRSAFEVEATEAERRRRRGEALWSTHRCQEPSSTVKEPSTMSAIVSPPRRKPAPGPLAPGEVAFLVSPGRLGATYAPVEVVKVNKASVVVRDARGRIHKVPPTELSRRSGAGLPEAPASRAEALVQDYQEATEAVEAARRATWEASARRRGALEGLAALGWSTADIGERLGLTRSRVGQILRGE